MVEGQKSVETAFKLRTDLRELRRYMMLVL